MGISGLELLVIGILALIVIGPEDLPIALRRFGRAVGQLRRMASDFRAQMDTLAREMERTAAAATKAPRPDVAKSTTPPGPTTATDGG